MRTLRAAFVVTLTAACTHTPPPQPQMEPTHNPPAIPEPAGDASTSPPLPTNPPPPTNPSMCPPRASLHRGDRCAPDGLACYLPTDGCQPSGFRCAEGVWQEVEITCNPPPPPR